MEQAAKRARHRERGAEFIFGIAAAMSIVAVALICWFIFSTTIPTIMEIGVTDFLFSTKWAPANNAFGILPMIAGSIVVTLGAAVIGVPIGVLTGIYVVFYCPKKIQRTVQAGINLLAGIPSVVYGLWALEIVVPWIRNMFGGTGVSILAAMILLGIMILPTIIALTRSALLSVPGTNYSGAVALGATHERAIFTVVVPAAKSGILSSIIMGIGRAIGETMAVAMVAGNMTLMPSALTSGARTLTTNVVMEMSYATGLHRNALIATGGVLFVFILLINIGFNLAKQRGGKQNE